MSDYDTFRDAFGEAEHAVYPGHPVTLAWLITEEFETFEEAFHTTPHLPGISNALGSVEIPGAGGNVCAAMDLLQSLRKGKKFKDAIKRADQVWEEYNLGEEGKRARGQEQADRVKPLLKKNKSWWRD